MTWTENGDEFIRTSQILEQFVTNLLLCRRFWNNSWRIHHNVTGFGPLCDETDKTSLYYGPHIHSVRFVTGKWKSSHIVTVNDVLRNRHKNFVIDYKVSCSVSAWRTYVIDLLIECFIESLNDVYWLVSFPCVHVNSSFQDYIPIENSCLSYYFTCHSYS